MHLVAHGIKVEEKGLGACSSQANLVTEFVNTVEPLNNGLGNQHFGRYREMSAVEGFPVYFR